MIETSPALRQTSGNVPLASEPGPPNKSEKIFDNLRIVVGHHQKISINVLVYCENLYNKKKNTWSLTL